MLPFERNFTGPDNDKSLIDKMTSELPGLLNLALIGLRKLIKDNEFANIDDIKTVEENYRKDDPIEAFIPEKCDVDIGPWAICGDLYDAYLKYYKDKHSGSIAAAVNDTIFGMELKRKGISRKQKRINMVKEYVYHNIRLKGPLN